MRWRPSHSSKAFLLNANSDCSRCTQVKPAFDPSVARSRVSSSRYVGLVAYRAQQLVKEAVKLHVYKHVCVLCWKHVCLALLQTCLLGVA